MIFQAIFVGRVLILTTLLICGEVESISTNDSVVNETNAAVRPTIENFQNRFEFLKNDELQVSIVNNLYGSLNFLNKRADPRTKLEDLSEKLKINIEIISAVLERAKTSFKTQNTKSISKYKQSVIVPCKDDTNEHVSEMTDSSVIDYSENSVSEILRILYYDLWGLKNALKKVYFLSLTNTPLSDSEIIDNYCHVDHFKLWKTYMSHNTYTTRRIILLIDHGNSVEDSVLLLSKQFAKQMISVLNESDKFTVIAIASKWSSLTVTESCGNPNLPSILAATDNNKELSYNFIDELSSKSEITDHSIGMKTAMKMARLFYAGDETVMLVYISPGMEFSMSDAMDIINVSDLSSPLVINTCSVSSGTLPDTHDMSILSNIMNDFFIEKNIKNSQRISRGHLAFINDPSSIGPAVARFYEMYNSRLHRTTTKLSLPLWDSVSQDLTTTFSIGFSIGNRFIVLGIDLYFSTFLRDVIYYSNYQKNMSVILMDFAGTVLVHPSIPPKRLEKPIKFAHISKYLPQDFDTDIFFQKTEGTFTVENTAKTYIWKHLDNIYVICMVVNNIEDISVVPSKLNWLPSLVNSQLVSYLIDLAGSTAVCKQLGHISNMESPSLYLSQSCFHHSSQKDNISVTSKLLPYFKGENLLMKHEGLQEGIRDELAALVQLTDFLKKKHLESSNADYIIRRYVATKTGIVHIFPGATLGPDFEPSKRLWFLRADEMQGRIIVSPPYLDAGGAGYIVTISYATHFVVLGIDVTYGFILKMILEQNLDCSNNTCFLVDDRGYLISHPDIITYLENENEPVEQLHIVHKESSVANDLLNHVEFVQKLACNDFTTATIQRYYQLNLTFTDVLTRFVLGEPCVSYSIGPMKGTNLFFGIVRAACPITRTFCPCSVVDRICLNCGNMEKQECECPCECQIQRSSCSNYTSHDNYKICDTALKSQSPEPVFSYENSEDVPQCTSLNCEQKTSYLSCLGVAGCEWCKNDTYGFFLDAPFCASMSSCFNGILGGPSPYKDGNIGTAHIFSSIKNTGFVLGLIVVFGIVFVLIFVCIRSYNNIPRNSRVYLSARQEHLHMSDLNINDDFLEQGNHSDKLLIEEKKRTPISPYCVTSNYSRPTTAVDSDHGYSTMTPHDESEHLSLAPIEIDSLEEDMASDRTTPPIKHKAPMTRIPHKNYIIVPVTVHRHVDAL